MDSIYKYPKINGKTNYDVSFEIIFRNNIDFKGSYKGIFSQ